MKEIASICTRAATLACVLLAASLPALGQSSNPAEITVFANDHDGTSATADFYIVNNTSDTVSCTGENGWSLPSSFCSTIKPWHVVATTSLDLSRASRGFLNFGIGPQGKGFLLFTNTYDGNKPVYWQLQGTYFFFVVGATPTVDPASGACAYTGAYSTAGYNASYSVNLTKTFWYDASSDDATKNHSKIVLVLSENPSGSSGQSYLTNCSAISD